MICSNCSETLPDDARFCSQCGNAITMVPPVPSPSDTTMLGQNAGQTSNRSHTKEVVGSLLVGVLVMALVWGCQQWSGANKSATSPLLAKVVRHDPGVNTFATTRGNGLVWAAACDGPLTDKDGTPLPEPTLVLECSIIAGNEGRSPSVTFRPQDVLLIDHQNAVHHIPSQDWITDQGESLETTLVPQQQVHAAFATLYAPYGDYLSLLPIRLAWQPSLGSETVSLSLLTDQYPDDWTKPTVSP